MKHGRDQIYFFLPLEVLNPHGSDETVWFLVFSVSLLQVLNPHGSDETFTKSYLTIYIF